MNKQHFEKKNISGYNLSTMIIDVILSNCFIHFSINQGSGKEKKISQVDLFYNMCKKMC